MPQANLNQPKPEEEEGEAGAGDGGGVVDRGEMSEDVGNKYHIKRKFQFK
jgi:hypothetical protein